MLAVVLLALQQWNSPEALALVERAVARRRAGETAVTRYTSHASGAVLLLTQIGPDPAAEPLLVKADELAVEVYWEAPNRSKQTVTAWREHRYLPTDIYYHRDHLGIVTDDFGDAIRLGEGDEVRNVVHPLAPLGRAEYDYALGDSLTLGSAGGRITVREVLVRPRDDSRPLVAGSLYLDAASADLVRFRFGFTVAAYLQGDLEDISVVLERALFEGRAWLPWRQQIEIRRRAAFVDFPIRTIIRAHWEIGDYDLVAAPSPARLSGGPYGGLTRAGPDTGWAAPLDSAIARAGGAARPDLDQLRRDVARLLTARAQNTAPPARLAFGSISDLARVNRVQGLALGLGAEFRVAHGLLGLEPRAAYGTSNERWTGGLGMTLHTSPVTVHAEAVRSVRDLADWPNASGVLNSLTSQEGGVDYGDWVELDRVMAGIAWRIGAVGLDLEGGVETSRSLAVAATPATGAYRDNPALGVGSVWTTRLGFDGAWQGTAGGGFRLGGTVEVGAFDRGYFRGAAEALGRLPLGSGTLQASVRGGYGTSSTPAWRTFALGGRGTLPGDPYRAWGGRAMLLGRAEWRVPIGLPSLRVGRLIDMGSSGVLAPFAALGWADTALEGLPWVRTGGLRPVLGVASELLFNGLRVELGWSPRAGQLALTVDATPRWWPIL